MYITRARCETNWQWVEWADCSLIIGTGCRVQVSSLILDSPVGLSVGIHSAGNLVSETQGSNEEDYSSPFDSNIACLWQSIEINNKKHEYARTHIRYVSILLRNAAHWVFIFGTGRYCVRRSVSPQVPENPSGPLVDNFIVLPCVAFGVTCVKLLPGVDRWNSLDEPRVIGPCHCEVWGWPRH